MDQASAGFPADGTELTTEQSAFTDGSGDYSADYESLLSGGVVPCDKSWVRAFRRRYEPPLFWSIVALGALGNAAVVWLYGPRLRRRRGGRAQRTAAVTHVYLLNLALADLMFLTSLPFWADDASGWRYGTPLCKGVSALYKVNLFSSMLLLTCISLDRYVAIVQVTKAHNLKSQRLRVGKMACVTVWLLSALLATPDLIYAQASGPPALQDPQGPAGGAQGPAGGPQRSSCGLVYSSWNNSTYNNHTKVAVLALQVCVGCCLPLLVMVLCYSGIARTLLRAPRGSFQKHKALRVILAVVVVFLLSQVPYNILLVLEAWQASGSTNHVTEDCAVSRRLDVIGQVLKSLAFTHAAANPALYVFVGARFRRDLLGALGGVARRLGWAWQGAEPEATPKRPSVMMSDSETTPPETTPPETTPPETTPPETTPPARSLGSGFAD